MTDEDDLIDGGMAVLDAFAPLIDTMNGLVARLVADGYPEREARVWVLDRFMTRPESWGDDDE